MITLNDYLYSGDTVLKILQKYTEDLRKEAKKNHNEVDLVHSNFLLQITELLEHNDFLTAQSQKIREFYKYMAHEYPFLAFTFKGRIKSLIRAEEKFNGYVVEYIYDYYRENGTYPSVAELKNKLSCFRDFIAYRIVVCMPRCHLKPGEDQEQASIRYLYEIANVLPGFLEERGFTAESAQGVKLSTSDQLNDDVKPYYRDYIYTSPLLATTHEVLQHEILPDIILMPNTGTRGILWQEIEGHDRQTPASMLLPAICLSDIHLMMLRLTGEFRWEMCKRVQGARWNDVTDHSLTSEFFDYLQFYKKNRDLSADAKEKCHMQLQKAKNRFKDAFILDYMAWVLYESAGSPRLNKVTRQILSRYCPFPKEYREKLKTNPLYTSLFERYENNKKKELTRMNSVAFRAQRNNHGQTPEPLLAQIEYLEK